MTFIFYFVMIRYYNIILYIIYCIILTGDRLEILSEFATASGGKWGPCGEQANKSRGQLQE